MSYYSRGEDDQVDDYDEYDPTPYGGGYDIALTYGRPIPPSDDTCHPISSSSPSDEIDYDRPNYSSHAEPSPYADEALETEYSSYSRPKPRPGSSYGGPQPAYGLQPGSEYGSAGYEKPASEEYGSSYEAAGYGKPHSEEYGSGGYEKPSEYGSGYGRRPEYEDGSGYEKPSKHGSDYGRKQKSDYGSGYERPQSEEYGSGYSRRPESEYGSGFEKPTEYSSGYGRNPESEYGYGYKKSSEHEERSASCSRQLQLEKSSMAGTCTYISRHVIELSSYNRASRSGREGASFCWARLSAMSGNGVSRTRKVALASEGPSCLFVGPIETASQETLEALYRQARDAYYSGKPLIIDDMFDRVELKLRCYGSKCVVKYPRCSIRRQSTYSDAEADISQAFALASIWILFLTVGCSASALPIIYTIGLAYQDAFGSVISHGSQTPIIGFLATVNGILFMAVSALIGYPIASASVTVLQGLWRNDLVALKGACPNCGEEVFAFVKSDQSNNSTHRADCHVCESLLEFRTKAEQTISRVGRRWVFGRIYLVSRRRQRLK